MNKQMLIGALISSIVFSATAEARKKKAKEFKQLTGIVQSCHDGDTCRVAVDKKIYKVRFSGIDTPEKKQEYGIEAHQFTQGLILQKEVRLDCEGQSYDRLTCTVYLQQQDINAEIVKAGWAWDSKKYSKGKYMALMEEARKSKRGMWVNNKISPFCYRHKAAKKCLVSQMYME